MDAGDKSAASGIKELVLLSDKRDSPEDKYNRASVLLGDFRGDETDDEIIAKIAGLFDENSGIMYNLALKMEYEGETLKAIYLYYIAALYGCKKAEYTLMNMGTRESCYFYENNYSGNEDIPEMFFCRKYVIRTTLH